MVKSVRSASSTLFRTCIRAAAFLALALPVSAAERDLLMCAALDLHLLEQIEDAPELTTVSAERLLATVEAMMAARRACLNGASSAALRIYEEVDLSHLQVRWLR